VTGFAAPMRRESWLRAMADFYLTMMRPAIQAQLQYRAATYMYLIGMVAEPVIYLVVWTTIARSHGGQVAGITSGEFAAYYIVWTLVRNMNIVLRRTAGSGGSARGGCRRSCCGRSTRSITTSLISPGAR